MIGARYWLALAWIRIRYRLELARIWIQYTPQLAPHRIRRWIWIRRRLIRNAWRSATTRDNIAAQLEGLTDPGLLDRIS